MKLSLTTLSFILIFTLLLINLAGCEDDDDSSSESGAGDDDVTDDDDDDVAGDDDDDDISDDDDDFQTSFPAGVYIVTGNDEQFGQYSGQVELRATEKEEGEYDFYRLIEFDDISFEEHQKVQIAWEGTAQMTPGKDAFTVTQDLRRAEYIKSYNDLERTDDDKNPIQVSGSFSLVYGQETYNGNYEAQDMGIQASENMVWAGESGVEPIWSNEDSFYKANEIPPSVLTGLVNLVLADYHDMEFFDDYRNRQEFADYVHYFPQFRTGFDFYREHPDTLLVFNKVLDDISMREASQRARAFKYTLGEKATLIEEDTWNLNIDEHGMFTMSYEGTDPLEHYPDHDGLLWTGTYVAAQAFRYMTTGEQEALDRMVYALDGVIKCVEITDDPTQFARTLRTPGEPGWGTWHQGTGDFTGVEWKEGGNNDMLHGIFYAFVTAMMALPDDPQYDPLIARMTDAAVSLTENCHVVYADMGNNVTMNWLCYMLTGDQAYFTAYDQAFNVLITLWSRLGNGMFYLYGISDWSGQHLNTVSLITHTLLAQMTSDSRLTLLENGFSTGMRMTETVRQALFVIAAHGLSDPGTEFEQLLDDAVWVMREVPYPRDNLEIDFRVNGDWCASPLPSLPWKLDWMDGGRHQGIYARPAFMMNDVSCLWARNPLSFQWSENNEDHGAPGYLHAYWLGRYYGVLTGEE